MITSIVIIAWWYHIFWWTMHHCLLLIIYIPIVITRHHVLHRSRHWELLTACWFRVYVVMVRLLLRVLATIRWYLLRVLLIIN